MFLTINPKTAGMSVEIRKMQPTMIEKCTCCLTLFKTEDEEKLVQQLFDEEKYLMKESIATTMASQHVAVQAVNNMLVLLMTLICSLSTRSLLSWVEFRMLFDNVSTKNYCPVHYALEAFKASNESRLAIARVSGASILIQNIKHH